MVLILAEVHVTSGGLIGAGAAVALIAGLALLLGATGAGLLAVLAASAGLGAASVSGVLVLARSARSTRRDPVTIQLRYLQTLREIGGNENSTIVFPFPLDLLRRLQGASDGENGGAVAASTQPGELVAAAATNGPVGDEK